MSYPVGSDLPGIFYFWKDGVLTDPSVAPTIVDARYPNFSQVASLPLALTHTATGTYTRTNVFTAAQAVVNGDYVAIVYANDATLDNRVSLCSWEVRTVATSTDVATFSGAAAIEIDAIKAKTDLLGTGTVFSSVPVGTAGDTTLVRGSSYYNADGLALTYTLSGYPALTVSSPCYWAAYTYTDGTPIIITGICTTTTTMRFELSSNDTLYLASGKYSLSTNLALSHLLRMPNDDLVILESVQ